MKILKLLPFALILLLWSSCSKDSSVTENEVDYMIFGHFYGMCVGEECIETYKLTNFNLYEDSNDNYPGVEPYKFSELHNVKFNEVKDLEDYFPEALLDETEDVIGCPDCADQGGIYIKYVKDGIVKSWKIDNSKNSTPNYLHEFMDKVHEKIVLINQ